MPERNKAKKNKKLLLQVGTVSILIFIGSLVFVLFELFLLNRDAYLTAKEEMIDRDLIDIRENILDGSPRMEWFLSYIREHPEDMKREPTNEEYEVSKSRAFMDKMAELLNDDTKIIHDETPLYQFLIARFIMNGLDLALRMEHDTESSTLSLMEILNEKETFLYFDDFSTDSRSRIGSVISMDVSEHDALRTILSTKKMEPDQTYYEIDFHSDGRAYYNGYLPVRYTDGRTYVICYQYDWSDYYDDSIRRFVIFMLIGIAALLPLNGLLMLLIYRKAIRPLMQVKMGVEEYKEDKNSQTIVEKMNRITSRNEIGVLADSFSDLATEIDRYSEENLKLSRKQSRIDAELAVAYNIQKSMLPDISAFPQRKEFDLAASMDPAKEVGGDFFDFFLVDEDHLCLIIADVSGKGVPAALFMMSTKIILENEAKKGKSLAKILRQANKTICSNNSELMFVTAWLGILELSTGVLTAVNAGHEPPAILGEDGRFELYDDEHFLFIGIKDDVEYEEYRLTLSPGSKIFLYTDGVPEATNARDELFGMDRMIQALNTDPKASPKEILGIVRGAVDAFVREAEQFDDLSMLCMEYRG